MSLVQELVGVSNVYTQHSPLVAPVVEVRTRAALPSPRPPSRAAAQSLLRGRMKDTQFPFRGPATRERCVALVAWVSLRFVAALTAMIGRPEEVIVFIVGGITFEEARAIAQLNASPESRQRIILGGTFVHNSKTCGPHAAHRARIRRAHATSRLRRFLEELSRLGGVGPIPRAGVVGAEAAAAGAARPIARRL